MPPRIATVPSATVATSFPVPQPAADNNLANILGHEGDAFGNFSDVSVSGNHWGCVDFTLKVLGLDSSHTAILSAGIAQSTTGLQIGDLVNGFTTTDD